MLAVVYTLNKFRHYITGYPIFVHIDHAGRLARWLLLLQEFDITIIDKPGKANVVANLSRIHHDENDTILVDDAFLDEHLFHIAIQIPWYVDIANYIASNKMPRLFSYKEKKLLVEKSFHFS